MFSEPGAGSDLASLQTRAVRDGDTWVINGQKVWTSGAQFADFGYILTRTDPDAPKHKGMTSFLVDMKAPGVTVRPLRQMTGGSSFNEVFFDDVRVGDDHRVGDPGEGWRVAVTTLMFERGSASGSGGEASGAFERAVRLARHVGRSDDPIVRDALARLFIQGRLSSMTARRVRAAMDAGRVPGPEGSIGKLVVHRKSLSDKCAGVAPPRPQARRRRRRVGNLRLGRVRVRRSRLSPGWRDRRDPTQHHRRAGPRLPKGPPKSRCPRRSCTSPSPCTRSRPSASVIEHSALSNRLTAMHAYGLQR